MMNLFVAFEKVQKLKVHEILPKVIWVPQQGVQVQLQLLLFRRGLGREQRFVGQAFVNFMDHTRLDVVRGINHGEPTIDSNSQNLADLLAQLRPLLDLVVRQVHSNQSFRFDDALFDDSEDHV